jgi:hypothetical protein
VTPTVALTIDFGIVETSKGGEKNEVPGVITPKNCEIINILENN